MNKKLVKTRSTRMNTLEAMACGCGCGCECDCTNCSAGGSFQLTEKTNRHANDHIKFNHDLFWQFWTPG